MQERPLRPVWIPTSSQKKREAGEPAEDPIVLIQGARREAESIMERARAVASQIIEEARRKAAVCRDEARAQGFEEGRKAGFEAGLQEAEGILEECRRVLQSARESLSKMLAEEEPKLLALVLEISKKIVGDSIAQDPEAILKLLRQGMEALRDEREFTVIVNPEMVALLNGAKDSLARQYNARSIEILGDNSVKSGVVVKTPHGLVDVTLETQIANIAEALAEARRKMGEPDRHDRPGV